MEQELRTLTLSTECDCTIIDGKDNEVAAPECIGDCWRDQVEWLFARLIEPWKDRNLGWDWDTPIRVLGKNMTWQHLSGHLDTTVAKVLDSVTVSGDFTLAFTLEGKKLSCIRSSHDEHSAAFEFIYNKEGDE